LNFYQKMLSISALVGSLTMATRIFPPGLKESAILLALFLEALRTVSFEWLQRIGKDSAGKYQPDTTRTA